MAKLSLLKGATSKLLDIFIQDSSSTVGAGLTGLVFNTAGLTGYYYREGAGAAVSITLATMTLGTWATGGFIVVDGTNMPGVYQLGIPDAALASGAKSVVVMLKGAANMAPVLLEIELTAVDNQDGVHFGITALPNVAAAGNGGLPTVDATNSVKIQSLIKKNVAQTNFEFVMFDSAGIPATGLTVTPTRSIDGGAFGAGTLGSVTEIAFGFYKLDLGAGDVNGTVISLRFVATNARDTQITLVTNP